LSLAVQESLHYILHQVVQPFLPFLKHGGLRWAARLRIVLCFRVSPALCFPCVYICHRLRIWSDLHLKGQLLHDGFLDCWFFFLVGLIQFRYQVFVEVVLVAVGRLALNWDAILLPLIYLFRSGFQLCTKSIRRCILASIFFG